MKKYLKDFFLRGMIAGGFGPLVLAIIYIILQGTGVSTNMTMNQVSLGIFSVYVLAFMAGGLNILYQIERLPLSIAILVHGVVLYMCYLGTYLLNGWLQDGMTPLLVFTGIFVVGYIAVWAIILVVTKKRTERVNEILKMKQQVTD